MYYYRCKKCKKSWIYPLTVCIFCGGKVRPEMVDDAKFSGQTKVYVPSPDHKEVPYSTQLFENEGHRFFRKTFSEENGNCEVKEKGEGKCSRVAVVKTKYDPMVATVGAMSLISDDILDSIETVLVKPNLALVREGDSGIVTNPRVVAGVLEYLINKRGILAKNIVVAESSVLGFSTEAACKKSGLSEVCNEYRVKFLNLSEAEYVNKKVDYEGKIYKFGVAKKIYEVDLVINVPVIKTHFQTDWSLALKNMKGVVDFATRKNMHMEDLHLQVALLNKVLPKYLTVLDGSVGLEGMGPAMLGRPANLGLVIASEDVVAAEKVVSLVTGLKWPRHSKLAARLGLGRSAKLRIELVGERDLKAVSKGFLRADEALSPHQDVDLIDGKPCSGCLNNVWLALSKLRGKRGKKLTGYACSDKLVGCPPILEQIIELVSEALEKD